VTLDFGIFDHQERRREIPLDQQYRERLDLVAEADRLGFYAYHVAEHHQSPLCMAPSQSVFLAAAAQRTERILLGALVYLLPFYHPVRLIEEISMLDNLTGGRLQVGVGKGISPLEHTFWGHGPDEGWDRFEETLAILVAGLTSDTLTYEGRFYQFDRLPMELAPKQRPYPPFWYAGNTEYAARHGMNFIGSGGVRRLPETAARYRELWEEGRTRSDRLNPHVPEPRVGSARHIFVAETDAAAETVARRAWRAYHHNFPKRGYESGEHPTPPPGVSPPPGPSMGGDFDLAQKVEAAVVGSPETVRAYVQRYAAESGMNYFVGAFQWGDLTHDEARRSLQLFAGEVMPAVRPSPGAAIVRAHGRAPVPASGTAPAE
jgi:alkanesulfonate monooxygenase SsuD/methylene tetrahydromethanopterin reductase-like flavin-dependent oxidoreductase (luciferase family)